MDIINKVSDSTILVTGGAGFIGSAIVDSLLLERPKEIRILDNLARGNLSHLKKASQSGKIKFIRGDVCNKKTVDAAVQGCDYVFHEAVIRVTHAQDDPQLAHEVIADGGFNVIAACIKHKVRRLVVSSSTTVYGEPEQAPIDEKMPYLTVSYYGACKVYTDMLLRAADHRYGLDFIILRPFNVYGPRMDISSKYQEVIPVWLHALHEKQSPKIHGDGTEVYDFTYVDDIVQANMLALHSNLPGETYNIGTGTPTTLNDLALKLTYFTGNGNIEPVHVNPGDRLRVSRRVANIDKAKKLLGYNPQMKLEDGLKNTIAWFDESVKAPSGKRK